MPPTTHRVIISTGLPSWAMSRPDVVKIPAPIMLATTKFAAGNSPRVRESAGAGGSVTVEPACLLLTTSAGGLVLRSMLEGPAGPDAGPGLWPISTQDDTLA